ncbi:hypothetical protein GB927_018285 [Shinella sp. CPCC 100929]|uniref:Transmembrane protein n=1 Tax=Shinella lacus TaxID=2654216 RepID=A0ABT1RAC9_9HYPH|nr:hypothetical protein [Shinella lacus]MCQ4632006.1 hypothetical protein [Shinella lacus]
MLLLRRFCQFLIFVALTILTQIGGVAYLLALLATRVLGKRRLAATFGLFILFYAAMAVTANFVAPTFGRVLLSCIPGERGSVFVKSPIYCLLNRNYVTPPMRDLVTALAEDLDREFPGTATVALDGNFPFWDGFPLLPHLSHDDGKKLDLAFYYKTADGDFLNGATRSPIGYFAFEEPAAGDEQPCKGRKDVITTRWNFAWLQPFFPAYGIEEQRTAFALRWLSTEGVERFGLDKIFLEPHIKNALGLSSDTIRFQGCRAARHDDHIHIQIR